MIGTATVHAAPVVVATAAAVVGASTAAVARGSAAVSRITQASIVVVAATVPGRSTTAASSITAGILVAHTRRRRGTSIGNDHWLSSMTSMLSTMRRGSRNRRVLSRAGIVGIRRRRCRRSGDGLSIGVEMDHLRWLLLVRMVMTTTTLLRRWGRTGVVLDRGIPVPMGRRRWNWQMRRNSVRLMWRWGGRSVDVDGLHLPIWALRVVHGLRLRRLCLRLRVLLSRRRLSSACLTVSSYGRRR